MKPLLIFSLLLMFAVLNIGCQEEMETQEDEELTAEDEICITYSMQGLVAYDYQRAHGLEHSHSDTIEPDAYATVPLVFDVPKDLEKLIIIPPNIKVSDLNGTSPIILYDHR